MNDCPREFDCDSCLLRGTLDCPAEYDSENEENLCYNCKYEEQSQEGQEKCKKTKIKPCIVLWSSI